MNRRTEKSGRLLRFMDKHKELINRNSKSDRLERRWKRK